MESELESSELRARLKSLIERPDIRPLVETVMEDEEMLQVTFVATHFDSWYRTAAVTHRGMYVV